MFRKIDGRSILLSFVLIGLTVATIKGQARGFQSSSYQPEDLTEDCKKFISEIQSGYNYGWVQNKEVITDKRSKLIPIFYYYKKDSTLKNPVLFFNGGPGYNSHSVYPDLEKSNRNFAGDRIDFIFMDQRGTGCSQGYFPVGIDDATLSRLQGYGSEGIVYDAEMIRAKLIGEQTKWKIYGQSFGAMIVYRYLEIMPQSITAAFAHGNAAIVSDYQRNYNRVSAEVNIFTKWAKANPKDSNRLRILQKYTSDPTKCFMQNIRNICGYEILNPFLARLGFRHLWKEISTKLQTLVPINQVDEIALTGFVSDTYNVFFSFHGFNFNEYVNTNSVFLNVSGHFDWDSSPVDSRSCSKILNDIAKKYKTTIDGLWPTTCSAPMQFNYVDEIGLILDKKQSVIKPKFIDINQVQQNIQTYNIPLYVYSGALDSFVPPESFVAQTAILKRPASYTKFEGSGHEGYFTEIKIFRDLIL